MNAEMRSLLDDIEIEKIAMLPCSELKSESDTMTGLIFKLRVLKTKINQIPDEIVRLNGKQVDFTASPGDSVLIDIQGLIEKADSFLTDIVDDAEKLRNGVDE